MTEEHADLAGAQAALFETQRTSVDRCERVSFSLSDLSAIKSLATNNLECSERVSTSLAIRLVTTAASDAPSALTEIEALEEGLRSRTKKETQFRNPPLWPFWHKHFTSPRHIIRNLGLQWGIEGSSDARKLDKFISSVAKNDGHDPDLWQRSIPYKFVIQGLNYRSLQRNMTGDWIIFAKHGGKNYYLDLATHGEAGSNSNKLREKLELGCKSEFPFLFEDTRQP